MSAKEIKTAIINQYKWLYRIALNNGDWFMAEYYDSLIEELEEGEEK